VKRPISFFERLDQVALMAAAEMDVEDLLDQPPLLMEDTDEEGSG